MAIVGLGWKDGLSDRNVSSLVPVVMANELSSATNGEALRVGRHFLSISSISGICVGIQDAAAIAMGDCR